MGSKRFACCPFFISFRLINLSSAQNLKIPISIPLIINNYRIKVTSPS
jgi:hypothetical protein